MAPDQSISSAHGIRGAGAARRPRLGVVKFASCDGCQLTILDLEDELLALTERFEIVEFPEATSNRSDGPYDVLLVEGSISTAEQAEEIVHLRRQAQLLVTIGACATAGGIQALRNWADEPTFRASVYAHPEYVDSLATATPISDHVAVDAELRGCPIDPGQLVELLTALIVGRRAQLPDEAVCAECKRRGIVCVAVTGGFACLGPVTRTGCGALCPAYGRGCYACFGPKEAANVRGLARHLQMVEGRAPTDVGRLFAGFTAFAEPFRTVVTELGGVAAPGRAPTTSGPSAEKPDA
jgi:coenzyme F420-reducing hydrogenase gamma subunit